MIFFNITPFDLRLDKFYTIDLSASNRELSPEIFDEPAKFHAYIFNKLAQNNSLFAVGGYLENRLVYTTKEHFTTDKIRSIHLGIDIWAAAETPIFAPEDGQIHSFQNNDRIGDYGPTIIVKGTHTGLHYLFGHLSGQSLMNKKVGQWIKAGDKIGSLGTFQENGHWPPHLHFQIIKDMQGKMGDYPGVCAIDDLDFYKKNCPDPMKLWNQDKI